MAWRRIAGLAVLFALAGIALLVGMRPRACDPAHGACPDARGRLPPIGIFEHAPCNEPGVEHAYVSCDYLRRYKSLSGDSKRATPGDWTGIYRAASGMGSVELALDRDGWAALTERGDVDGPAPYEGSYPIDAGNIVVTLGARWRDWAGSTHIVYVPVRWGARLYLVQRDRFAGFVNDVNTGHYFDAAWASPFALARQQDAEAPLCGLPEVPEEWVARLHPRPLLVSVIHVEPDASPPRHEWDARYRRYRIEVDAGLEAGLAPGMELEAPNDTPCGGAMLELRLDDVDGTRARGSMKVRVDEDTTRIVPGLKLTTGTKRWLLPSCAVAKARPGLSSSPAAGSDEPRTDLNGQPARRSGTTLCT